MKEYNLTTTDLAEKFNVSQTTVIKWTEKGMPYFNVGFGKYKKYRFNTEEVEEWLRKQQ